MEPTVPFGWAARRFRNFRILEMGNVTRCNPCHFKAPPPPTHTFYIAGWRGHEATIGITPDNVISCNRIPQEGFVSHWHPQDNGGQG